MQNSGDVFMGELLAFAHTLADASGQAVLPHFRKAIRVDNKAEAGNFDPVTAADRDVEQVIEHLISLHWPDHGVVGEEGAQRNCGARFQWVIDPIDGTRAFIMGSPMWGTLIGLMDGKKPILGLMDQPFTGERFWSSAKAAHMRLRNSQPSQIATRPCARLEDAILSSTHPDLFEKGREASAFARLAACVRMTRYGGDCYAYCLLAAGFIDLVVEAGLKPHDIAALVPIIERAGGRVTTWTGETAINGGQIIAAGDPRLHEAALRVLTA